MPSRKAILTAAQKAHGTYDSAVERHTDELFGTPSDPDLTPIDERKASPGRVLVEWMGEAGPLAEAKLAAAVQLGLIPKNIVEAWDQVQETATTRLPGFTHHTMTRERDGMSQTYTWGPEIGTYVQEVTHKDADVLLSGSFAAQFRIVGYSGPQPADGDAISRFLEPFVDAELTNKVRHIVIDVTGAPQRLSGVDTRTGNRFGTWN